MQLDLQVNLLKVYAELYYLHFHIYIWLLLSSGLFIYEIQFKSSAYMMSHLRQMHKSYPLVLFEEKDHLWFNFLEKSSKYVFWFFFSSIFFFSSKVYAYS